MKCPECQFENRNGAKFCKECGNKLELVCPQCGTASDPGSKFCDECGHELEDRVEKLDKSPTSDSERKHVTILFSDLSGRHKI